ncbi:MAG: DUF1398 family protein [Chitinophagales bacterium]|nr:DUF1398 family protein [Chitinophagales bacterium]
MQHFTLEQLNTAEARVKSGADFPNYMKELIDMGVIRIETFVVDGNTVFHGQGSYAVTAASKYPPLVIAETHNTQQFQADLKRHQRGETDFFTFCADCAKTGVNKWIIDVSEKTCTYFDLSSGAVLVESIPL